MFARLIGVLWLERPNAHGAREPGVLTAWGKAAFAGLKEKGKSAVDLGTPVPTHQCQPTAVAVARLEGLALRCCRLINRAQPVFFVGFARREPWRFTGLDACSDVERWRGRGGLARRGGCGATAGYA